MSAVVDSNIPGVPAVEFVGVDKEGKRGDTSVLEESGLGYDPTNAPLDLTKAEKRRTTALMMAIQAYNNIIIKDAEYLIAVSRESRDNPALKIRPATMNAMVEAAIQFDLFISGAYERLGRPEEEDGEEELTPPKGAGNS